MTILESIGITSIIVKMVENMFRWFGHVERRPVDSVVRRVNQIERMQTTRGKGRPGKIVRETIR